MTPERDARPLNDRQRHLLEEAADMLADVSDPFSSTFLSDNGVTAAECIWLARELSRAARYYLAGKEPQ